VSVVRRLLVLPIRVYQRFLSPLKPPSCRFEPSCSEYGARAILVHGPLKGIALGTWRILRCHPFAAGGLDPVPAPGRWRGRDAGHTPAADPGPSGSPSSSQTPKSTAHTSRKTSE
jgi:putative membrane protein insertion efficiency factor